MTYSMSAILLYVSASSLLSPGAFLQNSNLTLIIGACHCRLCSEQHQIPAEAKRPSTELFHPSKDVSVMSDMIPHWEPLDPDWLITFQWKAGKRCFFHWVLLTAAVSFSPRSDEPVGSSAGLTFYKNTRAIGSVSGSVCLGKPLPAES